VVTCESEWATDPLMAVRKTVVTSAKRMIARVFGFGVGGVEVLRRMGADDALNQRPW
jgi:hypothetical protein